MSNNFTIIFATAHEYSFTFEGSSISVADALEKFNMNKPVPVRDLEITDIEEICDDCVCELSDTLIARMRLSDGESILICAEDIEDELEEAAAEMNAIRTQPTVNDSVAYVTVMYGAGIANLRIAIVPGVTTIEEIATSSLTLARLGKSRDAVLRCKFTVDGAERQASYKLQADSTLRIEDRVAGDKGSARCIVLEFEDGSSVTVACVADTLEAAVSAEWASFPAMSAAGAEVSPGNFIDMVEAIEGISATGMCNRLYRTLPLDEGITVTMEPGVELTANNTTIDFESETAVAPAATYTCTICLGSGINPFVRSFRQGSTLAEVLFDPTVLARLNQREADVRNSRVTINGTEYTNFNVLLDNNTTVRVEARVAGDKGI